MQQIPLFDRPCLNVIKPLKIAMNTAVKESGLSRVQIVDKMNDLADRYGVHLASNGALKPESFEKWINPNDMSRQMPMKALPVFCAVVRNYEALDVLARPLGASVIGPEERNLLKWARAYFKKRDAAKTMRRIETDLEV